MKGWHRGRAYLFNGVSLTLYEIAKQVGMPPETLRNRVLNLGLSVEEAVAVHRLPPAGGVKAKRYWFRGLLQSVREHSHAIGIPERTLRARRHGDRLLELEEMREVNAHLPDPPPNACLITYRGRTNSIAGWARELGIDQKTLAARLGHYQWSIAKALTTPIDPIRAMVHVRRRNRRAIVRMRAAFLRDRNRQLIHKIAASFRTGMEGAA